MSDTVIKVENLSKKYIIGCGREGNYKTLRDAMTTVARRAGRRLLRPFNGSAASPNGHKEVFWALKDVSFEVKQGEVLGVIGRNGAGKSTLLKVLSRITEPTAGSVRIHGRVASLLEVGTGFHHELTGRENVFLNGAILGMSRAEIIRKFHEIVAFAEVEEFLDTPVKRYSSGMYVRLAFAVAAHLQPELLMIDEVLAVGDAAFQRKCLGKIEDVQKSGRTVLFVSHNMAMIQHLCSKAILLTRGKVAAVGTPCEAIDQYTRSLSQPSDELAIREDRLGTGGMRITHFRIKEGQTEKTSIQCGAQVAFEITYDSREDLEKLRAHIVIDNLLGEHIMYLGTDLVDQDFVPAPPRGTVTCMFPRIPLMAGTYVVNIYCVGNDNERLFDGILDAARFSVVEGDYFGSGKLPPSGFAKFVSAHAWTIQ